jgi:hypothetical protein
MFVEKTCYVEVVNGIEKPGIHFPDQKSITENIQTMTELIKQYCRI